MAPILLTRVCRRWREVAVDMPSLWCRLSIKVFLKDWQHNAFCYDTWLKRSRGRPLSLALQWQEHVLTELQSLLQPYLKHVSSLSILSLENAEKPALVLRNLSELQQLTIRMVGPFEPALTQFFPCMPSTLRNLEDQHIQLNCMPSFAPTCSQPLLVKHWYIVLRNTGLNTVHTHQTSILAHQLCHGFTNQLPDFFNALSFPNLRILDAPMYQDGFEELKALLARSNSPLERLVLRVGVMADEQQAEYGALISSLGPLVNLQATQNLLHISQ
ncbi:uncharacterized protein BJ212DRAFT_1478073 [Suillus subaureus]|uniref:F-box domain-containing protein n=1 Tax=Suillus subaureus TaxID=48587 RepID=A0A9P7EH47_9AGAM|nr:uncharacterized protein BJ212DRAFT_1478073 [Suillus subaureus]KAG1820981.1 hypothetical protein BJ212DRAFT_1478073 [Suillus subaureus]